MKKLNEMSVKELREIAKELEIPGRWDMNKTKLIEKITEKQEVKKSSKSKTKKEVKKSMKVKRYFIDAKSNKGDENAYIFIKISNVSSEEALEYVNKLCKNMSEADKEFNTVYSLCEGWILDENSGFTGKISFKREKGLIAYQRLYVGKLMTVEMHKLANKEAK